MIARFWRGVTPESKAKDYFEYLKSTGIRDARRVKGNQGVLVMRRISEGHAEFLVFSLWDSPDTVREFSGADISKSKYYPRDMEFLVDLEPEVAHYEVLLGP